MKTIDIAIAACQQQSAPSQSTRSDPPPDLNTVEACQNAKLGRYCDSTFRFRRDGCWANTDHERWRNAASSHVIHSAAGSVARDQIGLAVWRAVAGCERDEDLVAAE